MKPFRWNHKKMVHPVDACFLLYTIKSINNKMFQACKYKTLILLAGRFY